MGKGEGVQVEERERGGKDEDVVGVEEGVGFGVDGTAGLEEREGAGARELVRGGDEGEFVCPGFDGGGESEGACVD